MLVQKVLFIDYYLRLYELLEYNQVYLFTYLRSFVIFIALRTLSIASALECCQ
jgi:hypothetical protein